MFRFSSLALLVVLLVQISCTSRTESGGSGDLLGSPLTSQTPAQFNYNDKMLHWENSHEIIFRKADYELKSPSVIDSDYQAYAQWIVEANVQNLLVRVPGPGCVAALPGVRNFEVLAKALQSLQWGGVLWFTPDTIENSDSWDCWATGPAPLDSWKTYIDVLSDYNDTLINNGVPSNYVFHGLLLEAEGSSFKDDFVNNSENYGWGSGASTVGSYLIAQGFSRWNGDSWSTVPSSIGAHEIKLGYGIGADQLKMGPPEITVSGVDVDMLVLELYNLDYLESVSALKPSALIAANKPVAVAAEYESILSQYPTQQNSIYAAPATVASINAGEIVFVFSYEKYIQGAAAGVFGSQGWSAADFAKMLIEFKSAMQAAQGYSAVRTGVYHQPVKETLPACDTSLNNCYKGFRPRYAGDWGV
jgi:hypothetical protein